MVAYESSNWPGRADAWQPPVPFGSGFESGWPRPKPFSVVDLLAVAWRRKLLIAASVLATLAGSAAYLAHQTPVFRATVELLIDPQALQVVGRDIIASGASASLDFANVDSQPLVIASSGVLGKVIDTLHLDQDPVFTAKAAATGAEPAAAARRTAALDALRESIVVHRVDPSLVFQITVSHPEAARAAEIANQIAAQYFRESTAQRLDAARTANDSLLGQTRALRGQLDSAEAAVQRFRAENGLISTGQSGLIVDQQLKDLTGQIGTAQADLARFTARSDQIQGLGSAQVLAGASSEALASPTIASLRAQYASADAQLSRLAATLGPRNPQLVELRFQRDAVLRLLDAEIARIARAATGDSARATATLRSLEARAAALTRSQLASGDAQIRLRQLESEVDATRSVYNAALDRTKELEQQQQIQTSNSRVISEAVAPLKAAGPSRVLVLAAGGLFGIALGIALAYLAELLPRRLRSAEALIVALGTSLLGTLASQRRRGRRGTTPADDVQLLAGTAKTLRFRLGRSLPATVLLVPVGETDLGRVGSALVEALGATGQKTLLVSLDECMRTSQRTALPGPAAHEPVQDHAPDRDEDRRQLSLALSAQPAAGSSRASPEARTASEAGQEIILVWIDTPDLVQAVGANTDAIVLVGTAGRATLRDARRTQEAMGWFKRRVVGLVAIA